MIGGVAIFTFVVGAGLATHAAGRRLAGWNENEAQLWSLSAALVAGMVFLAVA
jgi:hypothetical protein